MVAEIAEKKDPTNRTKIAEVMRFAPEHQSRDPAAKQDVEGQQEELEQKGLEKNLIKKGLEMFAGIAEKKDESDKRCRIDAIPHVQVRCRNDQPQGVRGPQERGTVRHLLHRGREYRSGFLGDPSQERR